MFHKTAVWHRATSERVLASNLLDEIADAIEADFPKSWIHPLTHMIDNKPLVIRVDKSIRTSSLSLFIDTTVHVIIWGSMVPNQLTVAINGDIKQEDEEVLSQRLNSVGWQLLEVLPQAQSK